MPALRYSERQPNGPTVARRRDAAAERGVIPPSYGLDDIPPDDMNFNVNMNKAHYVRGIDNTDALSRLRWMRFHQLALGADME
ncbi:hypothetical protein NDU88_001280 [Pleurodeles waltl]|uniref:Uncharacterized protein n=1 Tax=Pleurodeles waltl TaxID=8319 RepID=A0AAV7RCJ1_PLEWA|nr:hypothetical protein NDU88_001280 [Pleurodeles waltl]